MQVGLEVEAADVLHLQQVAAAAFDHDHVARLEGRRGLSRHRLTGAQQAHHFEARVLEQGRLLQRRADEARVLHDDEVRRIVPVAHFLARGGGARPVGHQTEAERQHVENADDGDRHARGRQLEHAHGRQPGAHHELVDHDVGRGADERRRTGEDRGEGQGQQQARRAGADSCRDAEHHGNEEGGGCRVADEGREQRDRDHDHRDQDEGPIPGMGQDPAAHRVDDAGVGEGRRHDEEAEDHHHRAAAETRQRLLGRQQPAYDHRQQHAKRHDIRGHLVPREQDDRHGQYGQADHDLHRH